MNRELKLLDILINNEWVDHYHPEVNKQGLSLKLSTIVSDLIKQGYSIEKAWTTDRPTRVRKYRLLSS